MADKKSEPEKLESIASLLGELGVELGNVRGLSFSQVYHRIMGATMTAKSVHDREKQCEIREGVCKKNEETLERRLEILRAQGHDLADLEDVVKKSQPAFASMSLAGGEELSEEESDRLSRSMSGNGSVSGEGSDDLEALATRMASGVI